MFFYTTYISILNFIRFPIQDFFAFQLMDVVILVFSKIEFLFLYLQFKKQRKAVYNTIREITILVFTRIRWIGTGSHPYEKTMCSIVLYTAFYEYKNVQS